MSFVTCPECSHEVSSKALACAHCAFPLGQTSHGQRPVYVIEKTGRTWKQVLVLGWLLTSAGGFFFFQDWALERPGGAALGSWMWLAGAVCL